MQKDFVTAVVAAIAGVLIAYFVTNMFIGPIESVTFKTVDPTFSIDLTEPNAEVFNFTALNPTVEVFVGGCEPGDTSEECQQNNQNEANNPEEESSEDF